MNRVVKQTSPMPPRILFWESFK